MKRLLLVTAPPHTPGPRSALYGEKTMVTPLTTVNALGRITTAEVVGITVVGDVDEHLLRRVLDVCHPSPVAVAAYCTTDAVAQAVAATDANLRVGVASEGHKARLVVHTKDEQVVFGETITLERSRPGGFREIYMMLVPFDGVSMASSVDRATPARRELLMWVAGEKEGSKKKGFSPAVMSYGRLRTFPAIRTVLLALGVAFTALALIFPSRSLLLIIGVLMLVGSVLLHLNLRSLRERFGVAHG
jgi:hypothetical protein